MDFNLVKRYRKVYIEEKCETCESELSNKERYWDEVLREHLHYTWIQVKR